jgi:hypothetical protein
MHPERRLGAVFVAQRNPSCSFSSRKCLLLVSFFPFPCLPLLSLVSSRWCHESQPISGAEGSSPQANHSCQGPSSLASSSAVMGDDIGGQGILDSVLQIACYAISPTPGSPIFGRPPISFHNPASINIMRRDALPSLVNGISLKQVGSSAGIDAPDACVQPFTTKQRVAYPYSLTSSSQSLLASCRVMSQPDKVR